MKTSGTYITIEGIDGSGKSTVVEGLAESRIEAATVAEPTRDWFTGEAVAEALGRDTSPMTDAFLQMADRAENLYRHVLPLLENGHAVVSDRSSDSTYAYQVGRVEEWLPDDADALEWIRGALAGWDIEPDTTVLLDVSVDTALERASLENEYETREVLARARAVYKGLAMRHDDRYVVVDAERPADEVLGDVERIVAAEVDG